MLLYLLVASDRLDEKQEKKLKRNLPDLQAALQTYVDENEAGKVTLINECNLSPGKSMSRASDAACSLPRMRRSLLAWAA